MREDAQMNREWVGLATRARSRFLFTFLNIVDLVAILPFYVELLLASGEGGRAGGKEVG